VNKRETRNKKFIEHFLDFLKSLVYSQNQVVPVPSSRGSVKNISVLLSGIFRHSSENSLLKVGIIQLWNKNVVLTKHGKTMASSTFFPLLGRDSTNG
jgi:hypothetical protein